MADTAHDWAAPAAVRPPGPGISSRADHHARRAVTALGLFGIALIHLLDLPSKLKETPYLGAGYIAVIAAAVFVAEMALRDGRTRTWLAAAAVALAPLAGYILSRSVGLPASTDDIGNWLEPLGLASIFVESCVILLCASALLHKDHT